MASALDAIAREAARARHYKLEASEAVYNLALFFLLAERDIQAVKVDALTHSDSWRRSLCARIILLTIHELDLDKAGGNRLRLALENAAVPTELRKEVVAALRKVRSAQQKAQRQFSQLRNSTIAHRDADAIAQYRTITKLDSVAVIKTVAEFYDGTRSFIDVMPRLLTYVGGMRGITAQFLAQSKLPRKNSLLER